MFHDDTLGTDDEGWGGLTVAGILAKLNAPTASGGKTDGRNVYVARNYTLAELKRDLEVAL